MEQRRLGRIGHMSSVLIYGGAALSDVPQTLRILHVESSASR